MRHREIDVTFLWQEGDEPVRGFDNAVDARQPPVARAAARLRPHFRGALAKHCTGIYPAGRSRGVLACRAPVYL